MEITVQESNGTPVIRWAGRLDSASMEQAEQHFNTLWASGKRQVVLRLDELEYVSSAGLRVMLMAIKKSRADQGRLVLCLLRDNVREILNISGFSQVFPIFDTLDEALLDVEQYKVN